MFRIIPRLFVANNRLLIRPSKISPKSCTSVHTGAFLNFPRFTRQNGPPDPNVEVSPHSISSKYKVFKDSDSTVILDVTETAAEEDVQEEFDEFAGLNLQRGFNGVFEVDELVSLLQKENAKDIFVCLVPDEYRFVEHICIVTGRSTRHMIGIAEFIKKLFKRKRGPKDMIPKIEGKNSKDWVALDLGNIALHIFSEEARRIYDLEQLWSVGSQYDSEFNRPDNNIIELLEKHSVHLHDLKPAKD